MGSAEVSKVHGGVTLAMGKIASGERWTLMLLKTGDNVGTATRISLYVDCRSRLYAIWGFTYEHTYTHNYVVRMQYVYRLKKARSSVAVFTQINL